MHTTHQLIDLAKQRLALAHNLPMPITDYRLAKLLDIRTATVSAWRTGIRGIGVEFAQKFAQACELPEAYVFACIEHERTKDAGVRHILETIAEAFQGKAAAVIMSALLLTGVSSLMPENKAFADSAGADGLRANCILRKKRRTPRSLLPSLVPLIAC